MSARVCVAVKTEVLLRCAVKERRRSVTSDAVACRRSKMRRLLGALLIGSVASGAPIRQLQAGGGCNGAMQVKDRAVALLPVLRWRAASASLADHSIVATARSPADGVDPLLMPSLFECSFRGGG